MENAPKRDKEHAAQMRELRVAQSSLPTGVTDSRQTLPLDIEANDKSKDAPGYSPEAHDEEDDHDDHGGHDDHHDHH
jgi:hypothetical protein